MGEDVGNCTRGGVPVSFNVKTGCPKIDGDVGNCTRGGVPMSFNVKTGCPKIDGDVGNCTGGGVPISFNVKTGCPKIDGDVEIPLDGSTWKKPLSSVGAIGENSPPCCSNIFPIDGKGDWPSSDRLRLFSVRET